MEKTIKEISRRNFMGTMAVASSLLIACGNSKTQKSQKELKLPQLLDVAPDGPELKAGLIGCGGRGKGAAENFLKAGPNLKVTAVGDVFEDRVKEAQTRIKEKSGHEVPPENCFVGFDAYQKVIDSGVDVVILACPPHFRPKHFAAAIKAKKHVFMEKPVAVDPVGIKSVLESAKRAEALKLSVVTGTQRRHELKYIETFKRVANGAIGEIVAARCYWNGGKLWHRNHEEGWTDMEWAIRDWVNWCWLSGDHIAEQHVHNLDIINWFTGTHPVKAVGFGGRARRITGDQFDFFSVDYEMENGMHVQSMCRQIHGCVNNVSEYIVGSNGSTDCQGTIYKPDGSVAWKYDAPKMNPYDQEHIDLVTAIRTEKPYNEAKNTAISTMVAIMGRISAYTGKQTTWEEMMASELRLGPTEYAFGPINMEQKFPVPGEFKA